MDLMPLMRAAQEQLTSELKAIRAGMTHSLSKGESAEAAVRQFLVEHLPSAIGVAHGQIVDTKGRTSKQLDVILYDAGRTPVLYSGRADGAQVIPSEGVIAVIEVKTQVTASDARSIWDNMLSVKDLDKSAYFLTTGPIEHTVTLHGRAHRWSPTLYFVWIYECADALAFTRACEALASGTDPGRRVDMACFLDGAVMLNASPDRGTFSALPDSTSFYGRYPTENALLCWYLLASVYLLQAVIPPINLVKYLPDDIAL